MPDEPQHWTITLWDRFEKWWDRIWKIAGPVVLGYLATLQTVNHGKIDSVEAKQNQAADTAQEVKQAIATKEEAENKAIAANLYGTWKYLDGVAATSKEKEKAAEAKAIYEEFLAKTKK